MKQKVKYLLSAIIICSIIFLSGCIQNTETDTESQQSIQTILQKASNLDSVYYEIIGKTSTEGEGSYSYNSTYTVKVWQKSPYIKTETSMENITQTRVFRPDGGYIYNNDTKNYTKYFSPDNETQQKLIEDVVNEILDSQKLEVLGADTIDGKEATIIEYSFTAMGMTMTPKCWIWTERGIPLRLEMDSTMFGFNMTTTMVYKNFVFEEIPDSLFDVN